MCDFCDKLMKAIISLNNNQSDEEEFYWNQEDYKVDRFKQVFYVGYQYAEQIFYCPCCKAHLHGKIYQR